VRLIEKMVAAHLPNQLLRETAISVDSGHLTRRRTARPLGAALSSARMRVRLLVLTLTLGACATAPPAPPVTALAIGDPARRDRDAPVVVDAITATATGELLTVAALIPRLEKVRLLFVGESHTDPNGHEAQRRLIEGLVASGRPVLVGLEMFPYTAQEILDRWNRGELTEAQLVREGHWYKHWGFDWRLYREIFLLTSKKVRFYGVNTAREVISAVRKKGGVARLSPEEAGQLPARVDTASEEHRRLFAAYFGGGDATHGLSEAAMEGMFQAQCAWDATFATHAVKALESEPDPRAIMVVLVGSGHVAFGLGAPRQAAAISRLPMASIIPVPITDEEGQPARVRASYADYLWGLPPEPAGAPYPTVGVSLADRKGVPRPVITSVRAGSPGASAGLLAEDRVLSVDGVAVADKEAFLLAMSGKRWGDGVTLVVERAGKPYAVTVPLRRSAPARP
jgi:uncharacterized iron-regulated protein